MGFYNAPTNLVGVVVRAGTMDKVVKVRRARQKFDNFLKKVAILYAPRALSYPFPFSSTPATSTGPLFRLLLRLSAHQYFMLHPSYLITDPRNSTRAGDIVKFALWPYYRGSKRVKHIVTEIVSPFGPRLDERPAVPTEEDREAMVRTMEERVAEKRQARMRRKREAHEEAAAARKGGKRREKDASSQREAVVA